MSAWYELSKSSDGQFKFVLKAGNGEVILTSELYKSRAAADNGIASVRVNSPLEARYERKTSSDNKPYFVLKAANHEIIGASQRYSSDAARDNGIASVQANGAPAAVKDLT